MKKLLLLSLLALPVCAMKNNTGESKYEKYAALAGITAASSVIASPATAAIVKGGCLTLGWPVAVAVVGGILVADYALTKSVTHNDYKISVSKGTK